jgi:hypothetical protein
MKNQKFILVISLFAFTSLTVFAQVPANEETLPSFYQLMGQTMSKIQTSNDAETLLGSINELKRIGALYPTEWLSGYYVALFDLNLSFSSQPERKTVLLSEAKEKIDELKSKPNIMASEIYTLEGYYFYALIAQDPQKNGQVYYKDAIGAYQRAINIDSANPRALLMLDIFKFSMAKFMNQDDATICEELGNVEKIFSESKPKQPFAPSWGVDELHNTQAKYCSSVAK